MFNDENLTMKEVFDKAKNKSMEDLEKLTLEEQERLMKTKEIQEEMLKSYLSPKEKAVHNLYLENKSYKEIMVSLNIKEHRIIDNAIQRVKRKKIYLDNYLSDTSSINFDKFNQEELNEMLVDLQIAEEVISLLQKNIKRTKKRILNSLKRDSRKIYVFSVINTYDWKYKRITEVGITEKKYWLENGCIDDSHLEEDSFIDEVLGQLKLDESMESIFQTYTEKEIVKEVLLGHPSFEFDEKFQIFMENCSELYEENDNE